jgi:hypothetical protein
VYTLSHLRNPTWRPPLRDKNSRAEPRHRTAAYGFWALNQAWHVVPIAITMNMRPPL